MSDEGQGRVVVAMSGGVDSSVAAAMLVEAGADAIGVTMKLSESESRCCSLEDAEDARRVAERIGIKFYVANYAEAFNAEVIEPFADDYLAARTPIPCVACNQSFKFDHLLDRAKVFGAERVATGHYARLEHDSETRQARLFRGLDRQKDQSYFLFPLTQAQLRSASFPVGGLTKEQVRARARDLGLGTAEKPESQEICFVPDGDYAKVVERLRPAARQLRGEIVDESGKVLGEHRGVHHYTVGQRHGLGISSDRRLYVLRLDPREHLPADHVLVRPVLRDPALSLRDGLGADELALVLGFLPIRLAARLLNLLLGLPSQRLLPLRRVLLHLDHLGVALPRRLVLGVVALARELILVLLDLRLLLRPGLIRLALLLPSDAFGVGGVLRGERLHLGLLGLRLGSLGALLLGGHGDDLRVHVRWRGRVSR